MLNLAKKLSLESIIILLAIPALPFLAFLDYYDRTKHKDTILPLLWLKRAILLVFGAFAIPFLLFGIDLIFALDDLDDISA